ncbi:unnamed protein product, partial [Protopolystoma xenopodis]
MSEMFSQQLLVNHKTMLQSNRTTDGLTDLGDDSSRPTFTVTEGLEIYIPLASLIKFLLYMGWFKIGLSLINPLREDQSHFPMSAILDFNLEVSVSIALCTTSVLPASLRMDEHAFNRAMKQELRDANQEATRFLQEQALAQAQTDGVEFETTGNSGSNAVLWSGPGMGRFTNQLNDGVKCLLLGEQMT